MYNYEGSLSSGESVNLNLLLCHELKLSFTLSEPKDWTCWCPCILILLFDTVNIHESLSTTDKTGDRMSTVSTFFFHTEAVTISRDPYIFDFLFTAWMSLLYVFKIIL